MLTLQQQFSLVGSYHFSWTYDMVKTNAVLGSDRNSMKMLALASQMQSQMSGKNVINKKAVIFFLTKKTRIL